MINVTKSYLPDIEKYNSYIEKIYKSAWLTNNGSLVRELEKRLKDYLGVRNLILVSNGTIALELAYMALDLKKEVITTPFSFVATTSSLCMRNLSPKFSDIDESSFNLCPQELAKNISPNTEAILPVHVFGNPCSVEEIADIAQTHNLKVIYDAAHAFGTKYKGESILNYGDVSTLSFHATKLFHTIEGGAIITNNDELAEKIRYLINFGLVGEKIFHLGTNAKMNEFEAAMGLCVLDDIELILSERKIISDKYRSSLSGKYNLQEIMRDTEYNHSYFPIVLESEKHLMEIKEKLNKLDIFPRRYFYPSLDTLPYVLNEKVMKNSRKISESILCLPLYVGLTETEQDLIIDTLTK